MLASLAVLVAACGGEQKKQEPEEERIPIDVGGRPCPEGNFLTWENFGEAFLYSQCTSCHSSDLGEGERQNAPLGVDLNTYAELRTWGSRVYGRAGSDVGGMPPAGGPTALDRLNLIDWLSCDAPLESDLQ